jgi:hypothetical protein
MTKARTPANTGPAKHGRICYLCGGPISGKLSRDHIPPKQFYAEEIRRKHSPNLLTLPAHEGCNLKYQPDEDYFVYSLMPLARGSYSGDPLRWKILDDCAKHAEQRRLLGQVLREFERHPSDLVLPPDIVVKRFEGDRILRVAWKIVRGLYFHHFGVCIPDNAPKACELIPPGQEPPVPFFFLPLQPVHGRHPGVFDYRFKAYPQIHNLQYWAMLLWDRLILIVKFQYPPCGCNECIAEPHFAKDHPSTTPHE